MGILRKLCEGPPAIPKAVLQIRFYPARGLEDETLPDDVNLPADGPKNKSRSLVDVFALVGQVKRTRNVETEVVVFSKNRLSFHTRQFDVL